MAWCDPAGAAVSRGHGWLSVLSGVVSELCFAVALSIFLRTARTPSCPHCHRSLFGRPSGIVMASNYCADAW